MKNKFKILMIISTILTCQGFAQKDTTLNKWIPTAIAGLNISQLALSNWTQGGENSLTWTLTGNLGLKYLTTEWRFKNDIKIAYGRTKLGGADFKTNDNDFYMESVLSRSFGWAVDPFIGNTIRTTVTTGYTYTNNTATEIANFFDPGYVTQSLGFTYDKLSNFNTRLGIAIQEVFTNKFRQYSDDPTTTKVEAFKLETGMQSVTNGKFDVAKNLLFTSSLTLFTRFNSLDVWDVRWDNALIAKINNWMNVNLSYLLIYQKDQSPTTQMKQALQLGIVYAIL
ncbi:MAG: DUF3078 domain-containing protein [Bacteroidetes bacterium]|nr:DUF3078 domain-containing protein [Bacteroidota bacterium]